MAEARPVFVHAAAALGPFGDRLPGERRELTATAPASDLRPLVRELLGRPLRQASHLVELAVVGALSCVKRLAPASTPGADTAVYLGTGMGEIGKTGALFDQVMPPVDGLPSPFDFIHSASNMAAFYVAQSLGLSTRNLTLSEGETSFEAALELAWKEIAAGFREQALVGGVDESCTKEDEHLPRMRLEAGQFGGEGSGWMFLSSRAEGALGRVEFVRRLCAGEGWIEDTAELSLEALGGCERLLTGLRVSREDALELARLLGLEHSSPYLPRCGAFLSASAFGLAEVFDPPFGAEERVLHVGRSAGSQTVVTALRRTHFKASANRR